MTIVRALAALFLPGSATETGSSNRDSAATTILYRTAAAPFAPRHGSQRSWPRYGAATFSIGRGDIRRRILVSFGLTP